MYTKDNKIASLISSRICHDLVSPIGAISNGLELIELNNASRSPEMDLVASSVKLANAKIRFFRVAFGPASDSDLPLGEIREILQQMYNETRLHLDWQIPHDQKRSTAKLLFLLIMCLETVLSLGGSIKLTLRNEKIRFCVVGPKMRHEPGFWDHLLQIKFLEDIPASMVQFELARQTMQELGGTAQISFEKELCELNLSLPIQP